jgi:hypothetical protein
MIPQLFLTLAEKLAADSGPAECRSAISRAYYAVYNTGERFLEKMKFRRPKKDFHVVLQRRLLASGDTEIVQIGSDLGDFHQERIHADYQMDDRDPENENNAAAAIKKATKMIAAFDNCPIYGSRWIGIRELIAKANVTGTDNIADLSAKGPG